MPPYFFSQHRYILWTKQPRLSIVLVCLPTLPRYLRWKLKVFFSSCSNLWFSSALSLSSVNLPWKNPRNRQHLELFIVIDVFIDKTSAAEFFFTKRPAHFLIRFHQRGGLKLSSNPLSSRYHMDFINFFRGWWFLLKFQLVFSKRIIRAYRRNVNVMLWQINKPSRRNLVVNSIDRYFYWFASVSLTHPLVFCCFLPAW